ncbi:hypothetical protein TTHERM_00148940 (macronuclear) [Tetrahymena thermophila SB210]|uniref:Uncharacterized protein n=1 Tax=Tetrahymena thermophila (strain SB210) TaxID=312017 RepID=I7M2T8_TETTS|nr:hypothetical protein TTHERM_00148940 [Tetrahymena thermophila SB210]EAS01284.1 hypothetical protein TTHERM_00148940 [Tetrahymena thermophila SB210]|eukprot:XP_001021529.1 hypothetical protein TTHERM_00148940 [Tetrahymena thermophila SB210]
MENHFVNHTYRFDQPPRHKSVSNLIKNKTMQDSNSYLNQFYYKQMEIIKLQKALQGYQVRGKINPINAQRASTSSLNDSSQKVRLPQINQDNLSRIKDAKKKVLQPVKISAQIKYNLSKEIQDLQSNNLNGNYYYLQDKNQQWESRKQQWLQGLDGCLKSEFLDYQEMYEKFFKGKYDQKKNLLKSKKKIKSLKCISQNNQGSSQNHQNKIEEHAIDQNQNQSFQQGDEEKDYQQEKSFKKDESESHRNTSHVQEQTEAQNKQAQSSSQNTSAIATNRLSNQDQENNNFAEQNSDIIHNQDVEQNQQIILSGRQQDGLITEVVLNQETDTKKNAQKPQIKPIQIQRGLHENNNQKKKELLHQEHQYKLSIVSPTMLQNTNQSDNKYFISSQSLNSNNQAHQTPRVFSQIRSQLDNQLLYSPLQSNITSNQEFYPINNQIYVNYPYQMNMYLNTFQSSEQSSIQNPQTKFSLAQLKTKNFSKVQQSSQKSEDFFFRVSQVVNVKKIS